MPWLGVSGHPAHAGSSSPRSGVAASSPASISMIVPRCSTCPSHLMFLFDVNVLVYAHRADAPGHDRHRAWLNEVIQSDSAYGMSDLVLGGFLRIVAPPPGFFVPRPRATGRCPPPAGRGRGEVEKGSLIRRARGRGRGRGGPRPTAITPGSRGFAGGTRSPEVP